MVSLPSIVMSSESSSALKVSGRHRHSYIILVIRFIVKYFIVCWWGIDISMLRYILITLLKLITGIGLFVIIPFFRILFTINICA